jgi:hypothetical protein
MTEQSLMDRAHAALDSASVTPAMLAIGEEKTENSYADAAATAGAVPRRRGEPARTDPLHFRHDRPAQGCRPEPSSPAPADNGDGPRVATRRRHGRRPLLRTDVPRGGNGRIGGRSLLSAQPSRCHLPPVSSKERMRCARSGPLDGQCPASKSVSSMLGCVACLPGRSARSSTEAPRSWRGTGDALMPTRRIDRRHRIDRSHSSRAHFVAVRGGKGLLVHTTEGFRESSHSVSGIPIRGSRGGGSASYRGAARGDGRSHDCRHLWK